MKNLFFFLSLLFFLHLEAQNSSLVVFNENPEAFYLIVDGQLWEEAAATNVKAKELNSGKHHLKIVFENESLGSLIQIVNLERNMELVYVLIKNNTSVDFPDNPTISKWDSKEDSQQAYRIELFSSNSLNTEPIEQAEIIQVVPVSNPNTTTIITNTTTTNQAPVILVPNQSSTHVHNQIATPSSFSFNVNYKQPNTTPHTLIPSTTHQFSHQELSTITVVETSPGLLPQAHPVYTPPAIIETGSCSYPLTEITFTTAMNSVAEKSFDETKLSVAKQITSSNCLTSFQIKRLAELFSFEDNKLHYAKFAYAYCYDPQNYFIVNDVFSFQNSISELQKAIQP
ncbi:MAG: DUF4476 domain-containing protein [Chitinophagales bacterium]